LPTPFPVPGHPEAIATTFTSPDGSAIVESFTPHGSYVLYDYASVGAGNIDAAARLVTKSLDLQGPRIDEFKPTDPAQLANLPIDPDGLLARTLPPERVTVDTGVWAPRAALHFSTDPVRSAPLYTDSGLVQKSFARTAIYETKDADGAQRLLKGFLANRGPEDKPIAVPGLPSANCVGTGPAGLTGPQFECFYAVDHYVVNVASRQDADVQQQAAAQYLILTAK
jgi:hypothetical protein